MPHIISSSKEVATVIRQKHRRMERIKRRTALQLWRRRINRWQQLLDHSNIPKMVHERWVFCSIGRWFLCSSRRHGPGDSVRTRSISALQRPFLESSSLSDLESSHENSAPQIRHRTSWYRNRLGSDRWSGFLVYRASHRRSSFQGMYYTNVFDDYVPLKCELKGLHNNQEVVRIANESHPVKLK